MRRLRLTALLLPLLLGACAGHFAAYSGTGLQAGVATREDVEAVMGNAVLRWQDADGSLQLAFPRGPLGLQTYMAYFGPDGRLQQIVNVLSSPHFASIRPGEDDQQRILRRLGPPNPQWTVYFEARDELVWEWRICDDWNRIARFNVLFDGHSGRVRSTLQQQELHGRDGVAPWCGR